MRRFNCTLADKRGEFGECMEAHNTGRYVLFSDVEKLQRRMQEMLDKSNSTGVAIERAISTGAVPADHPLKSRLELLANHHKRELALADGMVAMADRCKLLADLLLEVTRVVPAIGVAIDDLPVVDAFLERIEAALAGHVPEPVYYMRDNHTFKRLSDDVDTAITEIEAELDAGWTSGMLCSKRKGFSSLHANYRRPREEFIADCRDALLAAAPKPEGGEPCAIEPPSSSPA